LLKFSFLFCIKTFIKPKFENLQRGVFLFPFFVFFFFFFWGGKRRRRKNTSSKKLGKERGSCSQSLVMAEGVEELPGGNEDTAKGKGLWRSKMTVVVVVLVGFCSGCRRMSGSLADLVPRTGTEAGGAAGEEARCAGGGGGGDGVLVIFGGMRLRELRTENLAGG
jgi:hypothetical protein